MYAGIVSSPFLMRASRRVLPSIRSSRSFSTIAGNVAPFFIATAYFSTCFSGARFSVKPDLVALGVPNLGNLDVRLEVEVDVSGLEHLLDLLGDGGMGRPGVALGHYGAAFRASVF